MPEQSCYVGLDVYLEQTSICDLRSDFTVFVVKWIAATADSAGCSRFRNLGAPRRAIPIDETLRPSELIWHLRRGIAETVPGDVP
jgi:hypothetical protein